MFRKYGSAPVDSLVFMDEEKKKEWDNLDSSLKDFILNHLSSVADKMSDRVAIEMLCHVVDDLLKRIKELENARN